MAYVSASPALRLVPSGRSLAIGFGLLAAAFGLFFAARETAVFAVHDVQVESIDDPGEAVARAHELGEPVLVTGSLYLLGDLVQGERRAAWRR